MTMTYTNINGYQIPNLTLGGQPADPIGKYGMLRREFLRENAPEQFELMSIQGTLYPHLIEIDRTVRQQVEQTVAQLAQKSKMPDRKSDPLGWTQWMNSLKVQAEELAMPMLYAL